MTTPAPWAVVSDVAEITGVTVTDAQLAQARNVIELRIGRTEATALNLSTAAKEWLRRAVSYQAAWMKEQVDLFTRSDVEGVSQDGVSAQFTGTGLTLAPLAKLAIRRLRWRGTRSIDVEPSVPPGAAVPYPASLGVVGVYDYEGENWSPL